MASHVIPINNMRPNYVRTGYDSVVPIRMPDKYCITAEEDGIVKSVTKTSITVEYVNKGDKTYKIKNWTSKEEANSCYTHIMVANLKVNEKFYKDDTLVYDKSFFEPDIFNHRRVIYKQGDVVTVALLEDPETYEDSAGLSKNMNKRLNTINTKVKSIIIDKQDNIENVKRVGEDVETDTVLLSIIDPILTNFNIKQETLELFKNLKTKSPTAKVRGTINKIVVKYNCKYEELSDSIKKLVDVTDKELKDTTGFTGDVTDGSYSIEGVPLLPNQVEIKMYIDTEVGMGIGDKAIIGNQLKFTVGEVFDYDITGEDGTPIDLTFSSRSIYARIVVSPMLLGTTSMVIEKLQEKAINAYFNLS